MDKDFLTELFASFGAIDIKSMFGGYGLSADGLTFGLVADDQVYLKTDDETRARFEAEGCAPFTFIMKGRPKTMTSYWRMPERLYDDPGETAEWAREALGVARRSVAAKAAKTRKPKAKPAKAVRKKVKRRSARVIE